MATQAPRDFSKVSDADLELLAQGKYESLSEEGARLIAEAPETPEAPPEEERSKTGTLLDNIQARRQELKQRGWENLSPSERLAAMALTLPGKMAEEITGMKDIKKASAGMVMRAAPVAIGQKIGEFTRIPGAPSVLGGLAAVGGEIAADSYEGQPITAGKLLSALGSGAVRGRSVRSLGATAKEAGRQGAINTGLDEVQAVVDEGELKAPSATAFTLGAAGVGAQRVLDRGGRAERMAVKKADEFTAYETVGKSAEKGFPIFPREAVPNQFERATNALVRSDLGLPENAKLTDATYSSHIAKLTEPHRAAARLSNDAELALTGMQEARAEARIKHKQYKASMGNRPDLLDEAEKFDEIAKSFETDLINETRKLGKHDIAEAIIKNRPTLSKTYLAMKATNYSRGVADARVYGDELRKNPKKLTGDAKVIGDTYNSRQNKEFHMKNMLSRPVTVTQTIFNAAEHTPAIQAFSKNKPSFHQYPDLSADAARFVLGREGRSDAPAKKPMFTIPGVTR